MHSRLTASYGVPYNYSGGMSYATSALPAFLMPLCERVAAVCGWVPNSVLVNYYCDGSAALGWHSDQTHELEEGTGVGIVSLGAERHLWFRSKADKQHKVGFLLG